MSCMITNNILPLILACAFREESFSENLVSYHIMQGSIWAYLSYRGTHSRVQYWSLPGLQRNIQESIWAFLAYLQRNTQVSIWAYLAYRGTHRIVSEPTWLTEEHSGEYLSLPNVQRNTMERAYLTYRGTHRGVSEPTWLTEEHTGEYLSLPCFQRNAQ